MSLRLETTRLSLTPFAMSDADELFRCITPAVARFMTWEPPSAEEFKAIAEGTARAAERAAMQFVIRRRNTDECLGLAGVEHLDDALPELGIWMKETAHGQGFGREAVEAVSAWASAAWDREAFVYPVAVQNTASRRIAERLGGEIVATRSGRKYDSVVYRIPGARPRA